MEIAPLWHIWLYISATIDILFCLPCLLRQCLPTVKLISLEGKTGVSIATSIWPMHQLSCLAQVPSTHDRPGIVTLAVSQHRATLQCSCTGNTRQNKHKNLSLIFFSGLCSTCHFVLNNYCEPHFLPSFFFPKLAVKLLVFLPSSVISCLGCRFVLHFVGCDW